MSDLPDPNNPPPPPPTKEQEPSVSPESSGIKEVGADIELPKEVQAAGVRTTSDSVQIPQPVAQMGVTAVQSAPPPPPASPVPLSDDQIAKGLTQSIANSVRWLAEWCRKRLKQLRLSK